MPNPSPGGSRSEEGQSEQWQLIAGAQPHRQLIAGAQPHRRISGWQPIGGGAIGVSTYLLVTREARSPRPAVAVLPGSAWVGVAGAF